MREENRGRLIIGVENLHKADGQIERIKGTAIETHGIMIEANKELHYQGEIIEEAQVKVEAINKPV